MANFLFAVSDSNWKIIKKENVMGLSDRWGKTLFPKIKINDKCIVYITRISVFAGIFKIISKNVNKKIKWDKGNYLYLFKLEPLVIPKTPIPVKEHINNLEFINNKDKWFVHFQAPKQITDIDYNDILALINK